MINTPSKPYSNFMMGLLLILGPSKKAHSIRWLEKKSHQGFKIFPVPWILWIEIRIVDDFYPDLHELFHLPIFITQLLLQPQ